jgi:hypothetical protein
MLNAQAILAALQWLSKNVSAPKFFLQPYTLLYRNAVILNIIMESGEKDVKKGGSPKVTPFYHSQCFWIFCLG